MAEVVVPSGIVTVATTAAYVLETRTSWASTPASILEYSSSLAIVQPSTATGAGDSSGSELEEGGSI